MTVDQVAPTPQPGLAGSHDLVVADLGHMTHLPSGRELTGAMREAAARVVFSRRDTGLRQYGTPLQPGNGRDVGRDALEEAADLVAYLRNGLREGRSWYRIYSGAVEVLVDLTADVGAGVLP